MTFSMVAVEKSFGCDGGGKGMSLTEKQISEFEAKGAKRWTKGDMDRLYINAREVGLECEYYKTGNIRSAYLCGSRISNSQGYRVKAYKTYIDIKTGEVHSTGENDRWYMEAVNEFVGGLV